MQDGVPQQVELRGFANEQNAAAGVQYSNAQAVGAPLQVDQLERRRGLRGAGGNPVKKQLNAVAGAQFRRDADCDAELSAVGAHRLALAGKDDGGAEVGGFVGGARRQSGG